MTIPAFLFYMFAAATLVSGAMVIVARNPVHAVLFLIFAFFNASGLFMLTGAEFLALMLVIVYVGAVAVLFLFVVMMLDINVGTWKGQGATKAFWPVVAGLAVALGAELLFVMINWQAIAPQEGIVAAPTGMMGMLNNTKALGLILYTDYAYLFQAAGIILLIAMIGAIVLTLRQRPGVLRQNIADQHRRKPKDVLEVRSVKSGEGIG